MSRELEIISREFNKNRNTILRKDINLYGTTIQKITNALIKDIEHECKKKKQFKFTLVVIIPED